MTNNVEIIHESYINGQTKQAVRQLSDLDIDERNNVLKEISTYNTEDAFQLSRLYIKYS